MMAEKTTDAPTKTIDEFVAEHLNTVTVRDDGTFDLPADLPDNVKYAVVAEKRRRDAQSTLGKSQGELNLIKAENEALRKQLEVVAKPQLSVEQNAELNELKFSDPDAWYEKKALYERQSLQSHTDSLNTVTAEAAQRAELVNRKNINDVFASEHNGFVLTDELLMEVPPRISKKLDNGADYSTWLSEVFTYLSKGRVVANPQTGGVTDIGKVSGTGTPNEGVNDYAALARDNTKIF